MLNIPLDYEFKSPWMKRIVEHLRQEAQLEGQVEGHRRGRLEAKRELLLEQLEARGFALTPEHRALVRGCSDEGALTQWARRVVSAATLADIFAA